MPMLREEGARDKDQYATRPNYRCRRGLQLTLRAGGMRVAVMKLRNTPTALLDRSAGQTAVPELSQTSRTGKCTIWHQGCAGGAPASICFGELATSSATELVQLPMAPTEPPNQVGDEWSQSSVRTSVRRGQQRRATWTAFSMSLPPLSVANMPRFLLRAPLPLLPMLRGSEPSSPLPS